MSDTSEKNCKNKQFYLKENPEKKKLVWFKILILIWTAWKIKTSLFRRNFSLKKFFVPKTLISKTLVYF